MVALVSIANENLSADSFLDGRVISTLSDYKVVEDATPVAPGDSMGGTASIELSGIAGDRADMANRKSLLLIADEAQGTARGTITNVSTPDSSGVVTLTADSLINRLNTDVVAKPQYGQITVEFAFQYYCGLVGIASGDVEVDPDLKWRNALFPGFSGNLWDYMKQMCSANNWQIYSTGMKVGLTRVGNIELFAQGDATLVKNVGIANRAQRIEIQNYNLANAATGIVRNVVFYKADQVYSVVSGETQEIRVTVEGTPDVLQQPVCVSGITPYPYSFGTGQYVVWGSDGLQVSPAFWNANGGKITATVSPDNPSEIIITITAPTGQSPRSPYRISEGAADRPALYITGSGVLWNTETVKVYTGDSTAPEEAIQIDNKFIATKDQAYGRGVRACQDYSSPSVSLRLTGTPGLYLQRKAYTQYSTGANLLRDEAASMGRRNGVVEGWTSSATEGSAAVTRTLLPYLVAGVPSGIRVTDPQVAIGVPVLLSAAPGPQANSSFDDEDEQWAASVTAGSTYSASLTYTRMSGAATFYLELVWVNIDGIELSASSALVTPAATGTSYTAFSTGVAPIGAVNAYLRVFSPTAGAFDVLFSAAAVCPGSTLVPAFIDVPTTDVTTWFGSLAGSIFTYLDCKYRVVNCEYSWAGVNLNMVRYVTIDDFNKKWAGKTIAQFNAAMTGLALNQFAVRPLMSSV